ncbi:MAG: hypothetical protein QM770_17115 [Tepidisphaeraceae bacterium]
MRYTLPTIAVSMIALAGCGGSGSTQQATAVGTPSAPTQVQLTMPAPAPGVTPAVASAPPPVAASNIPAGAQWTVFCEHVDGPGHIERSVSLEKQLKDQTRMPDWHLIHQADSTLIYYGYYASIDEPRAKADLDKIKAFTDPTGGRLFRRAIFVPLESPDPAAPPEWSLLNTPPDMVWTVEESVFRGNAMRKEAAIQRVKELRDAGALAFYYHGPTVSSVCIGLWPKDAVDNADATNVQVPSAKENDPNYAIVVDTIGLTPEAVGAMTAANNNIGVARAVRVVRDPKLLQTTHDFQHMVNYEGDTVTTNVNGKILQKPRPAMVVRIPRQPTAPVNASPAGTDAGAPDLRLIDPNAGNSLGNRLQGLGR